MASVQGLGRARYSIGTSLSYRAFPNRVKWSLTLMSAISSAAIRETTEFARTVRTSCWRGVFSRRGSTILTSSCFEKTARDLSYRQRKLCKFQGAQFRSGLSADDPIADVANRRSGRIAEVGRKRRLRLDLTHCIRSESPLLVMLQQRPACLVAVCAFRTFGQL